MHLFTASGAVVGFIALHLSASHHFRSAAAWMLVALVIDGADGTLARKARVKEVLPNIDGRTLDDLVDFLNYVIVPMVFLWSGGYVEYVAIAAIPILASCYGFSQADAKTPDHFFVGFPSYWNVLAIYIWQFDLGTVGTAAWLIGLSAGVFIPLKYVYPSRMRSLFWSTNLGGIVWTLVMAAVVLQPAWAHQYRLLEVSLAYPAWYFLLSFWMGGLARRERKRMLET